MNNRSTDFIFTELPPFNDQLKDEIDTIKTLFSGEFNKIIRAIPEEGTKYYFTLHLI